MLRGAVLRGAAWCYERTVHLDGECRRWRGGGRKTDRSVHASLLFIDINVINELTLDTLVIVNVISPVVAVVIVVVSVVTIVSYTGFKNLTSSPGYWVFHPPFPAMLSPSSSYFRPFALHTPSCVDVIAHERCHTSVHIGGWRHIANKWWHASRRSSNPMRIHYHGRLRYTCSYHVYLLRVPHIRRCQSIDNSIW